MLSFCRKLTILTKLKFFRYDVAYLCSNYAAPFQLCNVQTTEMTYDNF